MEFPKVSRDYFFKLASKFIWRTIIIHISTYVSIIIPYYIKISSKVSMVLNTCTALEQLLYLLLYEWDQHKYMSMSKVKILLFYKDRSFRIHWLSMMSLHKL